MYVGVCAVLLGEVLVSDSRPLLVFLIGTWICMCLFVLLYEEPALSRKFGMSYEDYRRRVPRWIPRLWPRRAR
jgi:protein-S-isoprenylcysteine O-methyltransferase Ste14